MLLKLWISWRYGDRVIDILIWYGFHDGRIIDILITRSSALKCISSDVGRLAIEQTLTFNPIQVVQILTNVNDGNDDDVKLWWKIMSKAKSYTAPCEGWTLYALSIMPPHNMHCTDLLLCNTFNDFNHKRIAKFSFCSQINWKMCQDSFKMFQFCTSLPLLQCRYHFSAK